MKRKLYSALLQWKNSAARKPLLLQGARQVGKTWLVKHFGRNEYKSFLHLNFERDITLQGIFGTDKRPQNILEQLQWYTGRKIEKEHTLLFFDEIQASPDALTSLKYFQEEAPGYHIIAAGSLLGVSVGKKFSFPVGKVNFMRMYPMTFEEYLWAAGETLLAEKLNKELVKFPRGIHDKLILHLKKYLFLGGMPEVLKTYFENTDIVAARRVQQEILEAYERDFSKYSGPRQAIKTAAFWHSVPYQLAKENKKFKYSEIRRNARASQYEQTIEWLRGAGLIYPAYQVSVPKIPLSGYADRTKFKVYMLDTGLLGAMLKITSEIMVEGIRLFDEYKGAFMENYVATQLVSQSMDLYYWKSKSDAEVDFLLDLDRYIIPLEVKSGLSGKIKSLRSYAQKFHPPLLVKTSPANLHRDKDFINIPLYYAFQIKRHLMSLIMNDKHSHK